MRIFQVVTLIAFALILSATSWSEDFAKGQDAYFSGDYQTAMTEWQPLAEAGQVDGQFGMGLLYANGFGVDMNDELALKWYTLAADQGITQAQVSLAKMYRDGFGADKDVAQARKWFAIAANLGDSNAGYKLEDLAGHMSAEEIAAGDDLANAWMESHQNLAAKQ